MSRRAMNPVEQAQVAKRCPDDIVVVYGPQGCGKSLCAQQLLRHFGLRHLVDDWMPGDGIPPAGSLVLTHADLTELTDGRDRRAAGVRFVSFESVKHRLRGPHRARTGVARHG